MTCALSNGISSVLGVGQKEQPLFDHRNYRNIVLPSVRLRHQPVAYYVGLLFEDRTVIEYTELKYIQLGAACGVDTLTPPKYDGKDDP